MVGPTDGVHTGYGHFSSVVVDASAHFPDHGAGFDLAVLLRGLVE